MLRKCNMSRKTLDSYQYKLCPEMDQIESPGVQQNLQGFKILNIVQRVLAGLLFILMIIWISKFRGGVAWSSDPGLQFNYHPILMTLGLVILYGEGMLIYRSSRNLRKNKLKVLHASLMILSLFLAVIGLVAVFQMHSAKNIPHLYTLHSWIGLAAVILFACQWLTGFLSFLYPGVRTSLRIAYLPIHTFFGSGVFVCTVCTCLLGLTEKVLFAIPKDYALFVPEGVLINFIGLFLVIFGGVTIYLVVQDQYKRLPSPEDNVLLTGRSN